VSLRDSRPRGSERGTVAILPWGDLFTDWLDQLGISLAEFRDEFTGSWMFGYARALQHAGVRPVIVCITSRVKTIEYFLHRPTGVPLYLLPSPRPYLALQHLRLDTSLESRRDPIAVARAIATHIAPYGATPVGRLTRVLRGEGCTAVLVQEYESPRFDLCVALGRILRLPVFATFQGGDYQLSRLEGPIRPITLRLSAGLIVGAQSERERLQRRYGLQERVRRVFNPIDAMFWRADDQAQARASEGLSREAEIVAWHGQAHPRKGLDLLLEAWRGLCDERSDRELVLLLFGGRRGADRLRVEVEAVAAPSVQIIDEWILDPSRIRRLLSAADVYAFPSRHEGFPVAPLEAMACGLPVVATAAQGVADIFEGGEQDGGLVVARDDVAGFASALGTLLDDAPRRDRAGRAARRRIESAFALERVGEELGAFLSSGAGSRGDTPP
jgi:glycosyltransferase involved in cell wall biosynthesis